jgi:hypothetical protein
MFFTNDLPPSSITMPFLLASPPTRSPPVLCYSPIESPFSRSPLNQCLPTAAITMPPSFTMDTPCHQVG